METQYFVANRDFVLRSKIGHSIAFEKDRPQYVPKELRGDAMERGALPCEKEGALITDIAQAPARKEFRPNLAPDDDKERSDAIKVAIGLIVERNNSKDFAGPTPAAAAVGALTGWPVEQKEVRKIWEIVREGPKA